MIKRTILYTILFVALTGCALNKIYLAPFDLESNSTFNYVDEITEDTLVFGFDKSLQPILRDTADNFRSFPFDLQAHFFANNRGDTLSAWLASPKESNGKSIYFLHGNAGHLVYHLRLFEPFVKQGYHVFAIDYSEFGFSQGKAKRKQIYQDALYGFEYMKTLDVPNQFILYGQSLGGHLAASIAHEWQDKLLGLVVEGAFSSHRDIAAQKVPILGRILVREIYNGRKNIAKFNGPKLIIHSTEDETISLDHGQRLFESANQPKQFLEIDKPHIRGPIYYSDTIEHIISEWK